VIASGGVIWAVKIATEDALTWNDVMENMQFSSLPEGPLELSAVGILIWIMGKWRSTVKER
jgi:hypothetical protein